MRDILELNRDIRNNPELAEHAMEMCQFIFSRSQDNLSRPMPWGDKDHPATRKAHSKPTVITDNSDLLISGSPPEWASNTRIEFGYDAPHAVPVEYGTPPHPVSGKRLIDWARRKLNKNEKQAKRIAYATAKIIKREGMAPHPYMRPAISEGVRKYRLRALRTDL